ncbi:MAG: hypothetical protein Q4G10_09660 [Bacteroidia bacterium]|nr:hypothetical protein [Bacteroidia bacterium]
MKYIRIIPFIFLLLAVAGLWLDPTAGLYALLYLRYIVAIMGVLALVILIRSAKRKDSFRKVYRVLAVAGIAAVLLFFAVRVPDYSCDAGKMEKHYLENASTFSEVTGAVEAVLGSEYNLTMDLHGGMADKFYLRRSTLSKSPVLMGSDANRDSLLHECGIVPDGFKHLEKSIHDAGCTGIETHLPDYFELTYRTVALTDYRYRVHLKPMTRKQKEEYLSDPHFIPYNDKIVFHYLGDPEWNDAFPPSDKAAILERLQNQ